MSKIPAEVCLLYIDKILGDVESGSCSPEDALIRISVWTRDVGEVALLDNGDKINSHE